MRGVNKYITAAKVIAAPHTGTIDQMSVLKAPDAGR
jgi:hypothetical protein